MALKNRQTWNEENVENVEESTYIEEKWKKKMK